MRAIFKREFRSYMKGVLGHGMIAFLLLFAGILSAVYQVLLATPRFAYVLNLLQLVLIVAIPVLAMRSVVEQRRDRTDLFLRSLPLPSHAMVLGRYLASLAVLGIACGVLALYPVVLQFFGPAATASAYTALLGFFLLGAALLALCTFFCTLTENPLVAALTGIGALLLLYVLGMLPEALSMPAALSGVLTWISPFARFSALCNGVLDLGTVLYDIGLVAVFLCLAYLVTERRRRAYGRPFAITAVLVAVTVALNVLLPVLPATLTQLDTTDNGLYSVSDTTRAFVKGLKEDVTVYVLGEEASVDALAEVLLGRYTSASRHVRVQAVDPSKDASFLTQYSVAVTLSPGDMIVRSDRRYTVVQRAATEYYSVAGAGDLSASQYAQIVSNTALVEAYRQYYGIDLYNATPRLALESALTKAIEYVTMESIPHIYVTAGNGELVPGQTMQTLFEQLMLEYETVDLELVDGVPTDASTLLIMAPEEDFSVGQVQKIQAFLARGGHLLVATSPENVAMPNLMALMESVGATGVEGVLLEGNANYYVDRESETVSLVNREHDVTYSVASAGYAPVMPNVHGIAFSESIGQDVSAIVLMSTSDSAYVQQTGEQVAVGATATAVALENSATGSRAVWMASVDALQDASVEVFGAGALYYFVQAALWEKIEPVSRLAAIEPTDMSEEPMRFNDASALTWAAVAVVLMPLGFLVTGITSRIRRARR